MIKATFPSVVTLLLVTFFLAGCAVEKNAQPQNAPRPRLSVRIDAEFLSQPAMEPAEYAAAVSGGDGDYSYIWDFNAMDGYTVDRFQPVVQHIYPEAGQYIISLHVADASGAFGEADIKIDVTGRKYAVHEPIKLRDMLASPDKPYIIDGYDIINPRGNGITLKHCRNVIICNCYIHDCREGENEDGRAIYAEDCHNITIQKVYAKNNRSGIVIEGNPDHLSKSLLAESNVIIGCKMHDSLSFVNVDGSEIRHNILYDNGTIWRNRISGISFNGTFHNISVHHNLVVNPDSDGIECLGYDWQDIGTKVEIYDNVLRNSGEQGVWFFRVKNSRIHHNYIVGAHNNGVCLNGWTSGVRIDHNVIIRCGGTPEMKHHGGGAIGLQSSPDNVVESNILIDSSCGDVSISYHEKDDDRVKGMNSRFRESAGNVIDSNVMCSSEFNISVAEGVAETAITNNVIWQRKRGRHYHGCRPDKSNVKAKPLFRAPERGDFRLLSNSSGYDAISELPTP